MLVCELIEQLKTFDQKADVHVAMNASEAIPVDKIRQGAPVVLSDNSSYPVVLIHLAP